MKRFLLLFVPHEKNNHRAILLQPWFLFILLGFYLFNQFLINVFTKANPGVLGYSSEITAQKVLNSINSERQKQNLSLLTVNPYLSESALKKAQDMFKHDYWAHNSPQGKTPWDFFSNANYQYSVAGENLAKDFYDTDSMIKAWMNSPTHRENIINNRYQETGIAVVNGVLNGVKTTLVVQHFGTPLYGQIYRAENGSQVLSANAATKYVSPLQISKVIGLILFTVIMVVLFIDSFITLKNNTHRLTGSSATHIGFLLVILVFMLFSQQGAIF